jgi:hypothetical protein
MSEAEPWSYHVDGSPLAHQRATGVHDRLTDMIVTGVSFGGSLARTASGKLQKQAIRASLSSVAVQ